MCRSGCSWPEEYRNIWIFWGMTSRKCFRTQRAAWSDGGYTLLRQFTSACDLHAKVDSDPVRTENLDTIFCPSVARSQLYCGWDSPDEHRIWILWEMTSWYVLVFRICLGRQWIHALASVPIACGQNFREFLREGGLRDPEVDSCRVRERRVFWAPCTGAGQGSCPQGPGPPLRCLSLCVWTNTRVKSHVRTTTTTLSSLPSPPPSSPTPKQRHTQPPLPPGVSAQTRFLFFA